MSKEQHEALKKIGEEFRGISERTAESFLEFARVWKEGQNRAS